MEAPPASGASSDAPAPSRKRARAPAAPAALRPEELAAYAAAERRKGVVYLSRIPPFMKPLKVRHLLEQHAEVGRVFLATEGACAESAWWKVAAYTLCTGEPSSKGPRPRPPPPPPPAFR